MKTILVPTDFTPKSAHTAEYACRLAMKLHAELLFFNALYVPQAEAAGTGIAPPFFVDYELFQSISTDNLKKQVEELRRKMEKLSTGEAPPMRYTSAIGNLGEGVAQMLQEESISLIVMGAKSSERLLHFFYGSDTSEVVRRANCPVLLVPGDADFRSIEKIAFASDKFDTRVARALKFLKELATPFGSEIVVTHVSKSTTPAEEVNSLLEEYRTKISQVGYNKVTCADVHGDDISKTLLEYASSGNYELLALVHRHHTFYEQVFEESVTKKVMAHHQIPYLVFPEHF